MLSAVVMSASACSLTPASNAAGRSSALLMSWTSSVIPRRGNLFQRLHLQWRDRVDEEGLNTLIALALLLQVLLEPLRHQRRAAPQREPERRHGYRRDAECGQDEDDDRGGAKDDARTGHVHARVLLGGKCTSTSSTPRAAHQLSLGNSESIGFHTMYASPPLVARFLSPRHTCASWSTAM